MFNERTSMDDDWAENIAILPKDKTRNWIACAYMLAHEADTHHSVTIQHWSSVLTAVKALAPADNE